MSPSPAVVAVFRDFVRPGDAEAVGRLVAATGRFNAEEVGVARELVQARLSRGAASGYEFLFVDERDLLVAYACHGHIPGTASGHDLYWIAVDPVAQGRGLGALLLREVERRAREAGNTDMWVETAGRGEYRATRAFYEHQGYEVVARLSAFYAPEDDKLVYHKDLRAPTVSPRALLLPL